MGTSTRWVPCYICVCMCVYELQKFTVQTICYMILYSYSVYVNMGQCPAKSPFWIVFQVFKFFSFSMNSKELLSNGPYMHPKLIITLLGTEFIISLQALLFFSLSWKI